MYRPIVKKIPTYVYRFDFPKSVQKKIRKLMHADTSYIVFEMPDGSKLLFTKRIVEVARQKAETFLPRFGIEPITEEEAEKEKESKNSEPSE